jgi:hypothetical protein
MVSNWYYRSGALLPCHVVAVVLSGTWSYPEQNTGNKLFLCGIRRPHELRLCREPAAASSGGPNRSSSPAAGRRKSPKRRHGAGPAPIHWPQQGLPADRPTKQGHQVEIGLLLSLSGSARSGTFWPEPDLDQSRENSLCFKYRETLCSIVGR